MCSQNSRLCTVQRIADAEYRKLKDADVGTAMSGAGAFCGQETRVVRGYTQH